MRRIDASLRKARGETTGVAGLFEGVPIGALIADRAHDADWLRQRLVAAGIEAVVPARMGRLAPAPHDAEKRRCRHVIENFIQKLEEFKRIAVRTCKTDTSFAAIIQIAATVIRLR